MRTGTYVLGLQPTAHLEAVEPRQHHVEQHEVGQRTPQPSGADRAPSPTTSVTKPSAVSRSASAAAIVASSSTTRIRWATQSMYGATACRRPVGLVKISRRRRRLRTRRAAAACDALVGGRQGHAYVLRARGAVEVAGRDEDPPVGEPAQGRPGTARRASPTGRARPRSGRRGSPASCERRPQQLAPTCVDRALRHHVRVVVERGSGRRLHRGRHEQPEVLAQGEDLAHQGRVARPRDPRGSRRGWNASTTSGPRAAPRPTRPTPTGAARTPAARPSPSST